MLACLHFIYRCESSIGIWRVVYITKRMALKDGFWSNIISVIRLCVHIYYDDGNCQKHYDILEIIGWVDIFNKSIFVLKSHCENDWGSFSIGFWDDDDADEWEWVLRVYTHRECTSVIINNYDLMNSTNVLI